MEAKVANGVTPGKVTPTPSAGVYSSTLLLIRISITKLRSLLNSLNVSDFFFLICGKRTHFSFHSRFNVSLIHLSSILLVGSVLFVSISSCNVTPAFTCLDSTQPVLCDFREHPEVAVVTCCLPVNVAVW